MSKTALLEKTGRTAIVTINRPEVRNCVDAETAGAIRDIFDSLETDSLINAVILTGAGDIAFSSGLDLRQLASEGPDLIPKVIFKDTGWAGIGRRHFSKPLIAAVNGVAIAGGLELMLSCDFAYASEHAQFGCNEVTLGPIADAGGCFRLPRWVPLPLAREMLMTGMMISADEAHRVGLVNRVLPKGKLMEMCLKTAETIAGNSASSMSITKSLIAETLGRHEDDAWVINDRYMVASFDTPDFMEGPRAFTEKRKKRFRQAR
ncbi:enoyl-CoA hydratase/isomerase family protein [Hyphomonas sp.]|uniref:enoyl-CoA hydratase/isomerase family protein n=1 Tax=Hyphomonas sp. TaxID=87 RepID=UPI00391DC493